MPTRFSFLLAAMVLAFAAPAPAAPPPDFTGAWNGPNSDDYTFGFDLKQVGDQVTGYHNAVARHGNRVDAVLPEDGPPSITGTVSGKVAQVHFRSGYKEDAGGDAVMTLQRDGSLSWKITNSTGGHWLPESMVLQREKKPVKAKGKG
jgi:hypothetical protein